MFSDPTLLTEALSHRSWCAENPGIPSNERLEFLGDSVVGLAVTDYLYRACPDLPEGELTKIRADVVSAPSLAAIAADLGVGAAVRLGKGEEASGGCQKQSILCDALEALVGAVFLDAGFGVASARVLALLDEPLADALAATPGGRDYKTRLQEIAAALGMGIPSYDFTEDGPDHAKSFAASVTLAGHRLGEGSGRSKKQAEQAAAGAAYASLASRLQESTPHAGAVHA